MTFTIALIGRPNVGKSTLFNRLAGRKLALVDDRPGVTRDRREGDVDFAGLRFKLIDTAGYEKGPARSLARRMADQTRAALRQADMALFMVDGRAGLAPLDSECAAELRRSSKPVLLVVNKAEGRVWKDHIDEFYKLGFGDPLPLSAEHNEGLAGLHLALQKLLPRCDDEMSAAEAENGVLRLAVIGRPNAGKSTLLNALLGEERLLTGPEAGLTRDSIAVDWAWRGRAVKLFDTAGLRKRARVQDKLEKLSVADALRAIQFAHVVVLLIDSASPFDKQDLQLADLVNTEGRVLIIGLNKWDQVTAKQKKRQELDETMKRLLPQIHGLPLVTLSGLAGQGLDRLMTEAFERFDTWSRRLPTSALNRWFEAALSRNPPPAVSGRKIALKYVTQVATRPPSFAVFGARANAVPESYRRYLINSLYDSFDIKGVPVRLLMRAKANPYAGK